MTSLFFFQTALKSSSQDLSRANASCAPYQKLSFRRQIRPISKQILREHEQIDIFWKSFFDSKVHLEISLFPFNFNQFPKSSKLSFIEKCFNFTPDFAKAVPNM